MRFVSHEVRTPLNSVCMGLELVQREIAESLGFASIDAMKEEQQQEKFGRQQEQTKVAQDVTRQEKQQQQQPEKGPVIAEREREKINKSSQSAKMVPARDAMEWFELTDEIMEHAQSAVSVLSDILNYDKVEAGKLSLEVAPLLIFPLIAKTVDEFKLSAESKGLRYESLITAKYDEESPVQTYSILNEVPHYVRSKYVLGDSVRLQQVLRNFLSNAIKFSQAPGSVYVEASWVNDLSSKVYHAATKTFTQCTLKNGKNVELSPNGSIVVKVKDTGAGMTAEQLSKLFTADLQFNANELQAGQGSGLVSAVATIYGFNPNRTRMVECPWIFCAYSLDFATGLVYHQRYRTATWWYRCSRIGRTRKRNYI